MRTYLLFVDPIWYAVEHIRTSIFRDLRHFRAVGDVEVVAAYESDGSAGRCELSILDVANLVFDEWCHLAAFDVLDEIVREVGVSVSVVSESC